MYLYLFVCIYMNVRMRSQLADGRAISLTYADVYYVQTVSLLLLFFFFFLCLPLASERTNDREKDVQRENYILYIPIYIVREL